METFEEYLKKQNSKTRYCQKCGEKMIETMIHKGFDRYTGKPVEYIRYLCPTLDWDKMIKCPYFDYFSTTFRGHYYFEEEQK